MRIRITAQTGLYISAVLTLVALALMCWSLVVPTPLPVMLAMSAGQALGTLAFLIYGVVVFKDITRARREEKRPLERTSILNIELRKPELRKREQDQREQDQREHDQPKDET